MSDEPKKARKKKKKGSKKKNRDVSSNQQDQGASEPSSEKNDVAVLEETNAKIAGGDGDKKEAFDVVKSFSSPGNICGSILAMCCCCCKRNRRDQVDIEDPTTNLTFPLLSPASPDILKIESDESQDERQSQGSEESQQEGEGTDQTADKCCDIADWADDQLSQASQCSAHSSDDDFTSVDADVHTKSLYWSE